MDTKHQLLLTDLPFPDEADQIYEEAQQFRRLPASERFLVIVDLIASGRTLMAGSPHFEYYQQQHAADEERLRQTYRELFARHGR